MVTCSNYNKRAHISECLRLEALAPNCTCSYNNLVFVNLRQLAQKGRMCSIFETCWGVRTGKKKYFYQKDLTLTNFFFQKKREAVSVSMIENHLLHFQGNALARWTIFHCLMWLGKGIAPPYSLLNFMLRRKKKVKKIT